MEHKEKYKISVKKKLKNLNSSLKREKSKSPELDLKISNKEKDMKQKIYNEDFIKILEELKEIQIKLGEHFRANAYRKAEEELIKYKEPIYSVEQIKNQPNIGKTIIEKLKEYVETGKLRAIEKEKDNPILFLTKIHGIGPKKAEELIKKNITKLEDLEKNKEKLLNEKQQMGLKYFKEISQRIPRSEIEEYKNLLTSNFQEIASPNSSFEIVGSYRRGAETSGDIDVIITNQDNDISIYNKFLDTLIKKNIIIEILSRGATKSMTIARLPDDPSAIARRIDFLYTPPNEYAFALLYFTGSKYFNVVMRQHALNIGYSLNEHGLTRQKDKEKVKNIFPNEEAIFEFLNLVYIKPEARINGDAVKLKEKEKILIKVKKETLKKKLISIDEITNKFLKEGVSGLKQLSELELTELIKKANENYYCKSSNIMTDSQYDILREYIIKNYPNNKEAKEGHASCTMAIEKNKVKLPYEMWSMDKIKPDTKAIEKWEKKYKGPYILSAKLDGLSALYSTETETPKLYTRGNGKIGQDISYLIPYLKLPKEKNITIRGEIIISKDNFKKYKSEIDKEIANARNFVAGIINQKTIMPEKLKEIDFVAYELIKPTLIPSEQIEYLNKLNIDVVINKNEKKITNEILSKILIDWRKNYKYEIDGIICIDDKIYPRPTGNPEYAFAFKMVLSDQIAEAKVIDILWTPTKDGYLAPRVQIEPIELRGSTINFVTGKNAKFIEDNKIGIGAIIKLVKAGDVIPEINSVIEPAPEALFPTEPYKWNDTHVEIMLINKEDNRVLEKNIEIFFKILEVDGLGPGYIKRIIDGGYKNIESILAMSKDDLLKIEGIKEKLADKIYVNINKQVKSASLSKLMAASNIFGRGFGEKKLDLILKEEPDILISKESDKDKIKILNKISGLGEKTSEKFVKKIPEFIKFIKDAQLEYKLVKNNTLKIEEHILNNKKILPTGFRFSKELIEKLKKLNVEIQPNITKNTDMVIVKSLDDDTGKINEAKRLKIPLKTLEEFKLEFKLD